MDSHAGGEVRDFEANPALALARFGERAFEDFPALVEDGDAGAKLFNLVEQMGGEENGQPKLAMQALDRLPHFVDALGVETVAGFVEIKSSG